MGSNDRNPKYRDDESTESIKMTKEQISALVKKDEVAHQCECEETCQSIFDANINKWLLKIILGLIIFMTPLVISYVSWTYSNSERIALIENKVNEKILSREDLKSLIKEQNSLLDYRLSRIEDQLNNLQKEKGK